MQNNSIEEICIILIRGNVVTCKKDLHTLCVMIDMS